MNRILQLTLLIALTACAAFAQTNQFSYQGNLSIAGSPANGNYDFQFLLFNAVSGGDQIGSTLNRSAVPVTNGIFTVELAFGAQSFGTDNRWLEILVKPAGSPDPYQLLAPRSRLNSVPFSVQAIRSSLATLAVDSERLGGQLANQYVQTTDPRLSDSRPPTAGSTSYIQNSATQQAASNFNISGTGTANIFSAATQYNIGSNRILIANGTNVFAGIESGIVNTASNNTFVGYQAGRANTTGEQNTFFGRQAGAFNTIGVGNAFFGDRAGYQNSTGERSAYFGDNAGSSNTTGIFNAFFGQSAGSGNISGSSNTFIGYGSGGNKPTGSRNTVLGANAEIGVDGLLYASAIGADSVVSTSNTIALGRPGGEDTVRIPGKIALVTLGNAGTLSVCRNLIGEISTCSSSAQYKTNVARFSTGLDLVRKLNPVSFTWKDGGMADLGLVAEDVAAVEPLLTTTNDKGAVEGVKYDRVGVVLVNAVKEQQQTIEAQQKQITELLDANRRQQAQIEALTKLFCSANPAAGICRDKP